MFKITLKNTLYSLIVIALFCLTAFPPSAWADSESGLAIPRFVSLRSDEVNLRTGPGQRYPIEWVYQKRGIPVEIINEFDAWRKVRDIAGDQGWIHKTMLSGRRSAIIKDRIQYLHSKADLGSAVTARIEPGVIARVDSCQVEWCRIEIGAYAGWIPKKALWGVYSHETF